MELYSQTSYELARVLTQRYSTSFSASSRLFDRRIRPHIYALYGVVRIADEIVDTYQGDDQRQLLDELEAKLYRAIERGYDSEPIVHAFALSARQCGIDRQLIRPFFESMRMDTIAVEYDETKYRTYIYGSAEVIGLMCLRVFCLGDLAMYAQLEKGAAALGAAFQKINFLRDMTADHARGRWYFPRATYETFGEGDKEAIVGDIRLDLEQAQQSIRQLPASSQVAVASSYRLYDTVLTRIENASVETLRTERIRVPSLQKVWIVAKTVARRGTL